MSVTDDLLETLKCCLGSKDHLLREPMILKCKHSACKSCIEKKKGHEFTCEFKNCGKKYKMKKCDKLIINNEVIELIEKNKNELLENIKSQFNKFYLNFNDMNFEDIIDCNCNLIENEIDIKIESIKSELDNLGDFMKRRLNGLKEQMISLIPNEEIEKTKSYLNEMKKIIEDASIKGELKEFEDIFINCKKKQSDLLSSYIPKLPFIAGDSELTEKFIGEIGDIIYDPPELKENVKQNQEEANLIPVLPCKFETVQRTVAFHISSLNSTRMAYIENKDELVICETENKLLKIVDSKTLSFITQINPDNLLDCPVGICTDTNDDIYIGDYTHSKIFVFDEYFEFKRSFGQGVINKPFYMTIDNETKQLYVCDKRNNVISIWNTQTDEHLGNIQCDSPTHSKINQDKLIVVCGIDYQMRSSKLKNLIKGQNCIFIFDKNKQELIKTIKLDTWFDLRGLCVDSFNNFYTMSYEIDAKNSVSSKIFLFKFDSNGKFLKKFTIDSYHVKDILMYDNKLCCVLGNRNPYTQVTLFRRD